MTIFEQLLYSTVRIEMFGGIGGNNNLLGYATGFLLCKGFASQESLDNSSQRYYLVSNKHVLDPTKITRIDVAFHTQENGKIILNKHKPIVLLNCQSAIQIHQRPNIDVAAMDITDIIRNEPDTYIKVIPYEMLSDFQEPELSVGEDIYFVGYPNGNFFDIKNNLPLIRKGIIASDPKVQYNGNPMFVVDAGVIQGSSGSPVIINLTYENMKSNGIIDITRGVRFKLLGIIASLHFRYNSVIKKVGNEELPPNDPYVVKEQVGLGIAYKSTVIKELIDGMGKLPAK